MKCNTVKDENINNNLSISLNINIENTLQNLIELYFDHKYEEICKILKIEHNSNYNKDNEPINKYNKNESGMIFYENENPTILTRVYVDKETKFLLNNLTMVTSVLMDEKDIIDYIIDKWLKSIHIIINHNDIPKIIGKESYIQVRTSKKMWNAMTLICKNNGISIKIGFKMIVMSYFNEISLE